MLGRSTTKINDLLADCPAGVPMTSAWLGSKGASPQLMQKYKETGWVESLGRGAWIRAGTKPTMLGATYALQRISLNIYPAAKTALELQGQAHYVPVGQFPVLQVSAEVNQRLPAWFINLDFSENLHVMNSSRLFAPVFTGLNELKIEGLMIKASSPERAMLEYCQLLSKQADFEEAWQLMQGLTTLRPRLLQSTLQACQSVKAKRLFLALASAVGHNWYKELNLDAIYLGSSNRTLSIEGSQHPRFGITVPETWITE
ncbi:MAG: type IV toxin-antitoxin system AbiEi family antitoxin domain-containing protein [Gammaproteobacteria bacterium]|nr:type IV toxin-antitoxin system AbiEi family antitoxin domain-containing protein [Gammaproteobacteria bacterium]MCY4283201.1 type IV toxin-antitoxin system AbiEi family antitoxin domain-containing protein [Gammaproteobacteria bacterium]